MLQARREWQDILKVMKDNNLQKKEKEKKKEINFKDQVMKCALYCA